MAKKEKSEKKQGSKRPYIIALVVAGVFVISLLGGIFLGIALKDNGTIPDSPFESSEFVAKIFPSGLWDFVIQLLGFVVLILFVFFVGYKPVKKAMKTRADAIQNDLDTAKQQRQIAEAAASEKDATIASGKKEANHIIEEAKLDASAQGKAILDQAKLDAAAARKKADLEIEQAKEKSKQETRKEIVDVALAASSRVLGREVSEEDNKRLVSSFIDEISGGRQ